MLVTPGPGATVAVQNLGLTSVEISTRRGGPVAAASPAERRSVPPNSALTLPGGPSGDVGAGLQIDGPPGARLAAVALAGTTVVRGVPTSSSTTFLPSLPALGARRLALLNLGSEPATVAAQFLGADGSPTANRQWTVEPGAEVALRLDELRLAASFAGSAVIASTQPVGVVVR